MLPPPRRDDKCAAPNTLLRHKCTAVYIYICICARKFVCNANGTHCSMQLALQQRRCFACAVLVRCIRQPASEQGVKVRLWPAQPPPKFALFWLRATSLAKAHFTLYTSRTLKCKVFHQNHSKSNSFLTRSMALESPRTRNIHKPLT